MAKSKKGFKSNMLLIHLSTASILHQLKSANQIKGEGR
jgi:hypothetical protein